jgi:hypothetical protein
MSLGEDIVSAQKFLRSIHSQTANLIETLDSIMASHGWAPRYRNVTDGIGPALKAGDNWLMNYLYRIYSHNVASKDHLVGLIIEFEPSFAGNFSEPVCLAFAARFNPLIKPINDDDGWIDETDVLTVLEGKKSVTEVAEQNHRLFYPEATTLWGFLIPLCDLHSESDLRTRIVDPLLEALRTEMAQRFKEAIGDWSDDESDEELNKALEELS